jgi:hypothetical protein
LYFINEKGQEQTIQFALETWWMTDLMAFEKSGESGFSIQALEKVEVMVITNESLEKLLCEVPNWKGILEKSTNERIQLLCFASNTFIRCRKTFL